MDDFATLPFNEFLDQVVARTPTPGGGSVAAAAGCLAAAMARMVAAYSVGAKTGPELRERIESTAGRLAVADQLLRALVTQDAEAYTRMTAAAKLANQGEKGRKDYADSVLAAIAVPMEMVAVSVHVLAIMDEFKSIANQRLISDLGVAAILAEATAEAAAWSVRVNLAQVRDEALRARIAGELAENLQRCDRLHRSLGDHVGGQLGFRA